MDEIVNSLLGEISPFDKPICVTITGQTGSGKTTLAKILAEYGFAHVSVDEIHHSFSESKLQKLQQKGVTSFSVAMLEFDEAFIDCLSSGKNIVTDFGGYKKDQRTAMKGLVESYDYEYVLVYLTANEDVRRRSLEKRNLNIGPHAPKIGKELFERIKKEFEPPENEDQLVFDNSSR